MVSKEDWPAFNLLVSDLIALDNERLVYLFFSVFALIFLLYIVIFHREGWERRKNSGKIDPGFAQVKSSSDKKSSVDDVSSSLLSAMAAKHKNFFHLKLFLTDGGNNKCLALTAGEQCDFSKVTHDYISHVGPCQNLVSHVLMLIRLAAYSIHMHEVDESEFLNWMLTIKDNNIQCPARTSHDPGVLYEMLTTDISNGNADWGVFNNWIPNEADDDISERFIETIVVHPLFSISLITEMKMPTSPEEPYCIDFNRTYLSDFHAPFHKNKSKVMLDYVDANGVETKRHVLQAEHIAMNGMHYLKGYCLLRFEERLFRFDRIILETRVLFDSLRDDFFQENNLTHLIPAYCALRAGLLG